MLDIGETFNLAGSGPYINTDTDINTDADIAYWYNCLYSDRIFLLAQKQKHSAQRLSNWTTITLEIFLLTLLLLFDLIVLFWFHFTCFWHCDVSFYCFESNNEKPTRETGFCLVCNFLRHFVHLMVRKCLSRTLNCSKCNITVSSNLLFHKKMSCYFYKNLKCGVSRYTLK